VLDYWEQNRIEPEPYPAGTWGPEAAEALLARTGRRWHVPTV
jgi:glucose-6-phosphate 1-dehydrogenase